MIAGGFGNRLRASWDFVLDASLILWICRVSAVSAVAGLLLFGFSDQARDTFLEVRGLRPSNWQNLLFWVAFFLFVILFWAMPVHFAARRNLELDPIFQKEASTQRQRRRRDVALWMPRLLAFLCLVSVSVGASFAQAVVRVADSNDTSVNLYAEAQAQAGYLAVIAAGLAIILVILLAARRELFKGVPRYVGTTLLASLFLVVVVLFFAPKQLLEGLTRAPLIPLLLGGWVPLFAWLANKGRIYHAPFIAFTLIVIQLTTYFGDNHEIRTITISSQGLPAPSGTPQRNLGVTRYTLQEKICEWQTVLGCGVHCDRLPPSGPVCDTSRIKAITKVCPRPIIIAASGGASRAGFYTAAILGKLVDLTSEPGYRNFTDQLFAISSVSGSSVGAAFFVAALRDMPPDKTGTRMKTPCLEDAKSPLFFRNRPPQTWRECMELLLSGDFLSSPVFTYLYGDALGGLAGILGHPDRAVALETAWEGQYRRYVRAQTTGGQSSGLETPFLTLAGFRGESRQGGSWRPLLFFNSTDIDTGRRVVVSSVTIKTQMPRDGRQPVEVPLYPDAYDLHLLLADRPDGEGRALDKQGVNLTAFADINYATLNRDIRLSTAAGLSARFPLISPAGKINNENKTLVGRLVDGGYYENFGAATAIDIAKQLKAAGLDPFIIEITNDPELIGAVELATSGKAEDGEICPFLARDPICNEPPVVAATTDYFFSDIRGPLRAFYGSRSAHGAHALWEAANFGGAERSGCRADGDRNNPSFMHLFLSPQYTYSKKTGTCIRADVPMSWWLSKPVQAHLASEIPQWQLDRIANLMRIRD